MRQWANQWQQQGWQTGQHEPHKRPAGRDWWIAAGVCQLLNVLVFSAAVWACVHWLVRVQSKEYYDAHPGADPDGMIMLELLMFGVCFLAACAVVYALVGTIATFAGYQAGPVMLWASFPVTAIAGTLAIAELCRDRPALSEIMRFALVVVVGCSLCLGLMAWRMPQRAKRPKGPAARPAPYAGGSPYLRPPGS